MASGRHLQTRKAFKLEMEAKTASERKQGRQRGGDGKLAEVLKIGLEILPFYPFG